MLLNSNLHVGVNVLVTPALLSCLPQVWERLQALGVRHVTLLRPKPPASATKSARAWYAVNRLRHHDLRILRTVLESWRGMLGLEVGSALVGLMSDVASELLRWRGIYGCAAGRRICTVWPDGCVTPCSFLADLSAGNVLETPFAEIWQAGRAWEALRNPGALPRDHCADCDIVFQCGAVRCIARYEGGELSAGDAECPGHSRS